MTDSWLTAGTLRSMLDYDEMTGVFTWRAGKLSGSVAGTKITRGYIMIGLGRKKRLAHRLAFLWMTGQLPDGQVDHINGVTSDNRWCNLRVVSESQNHQNLRGPRRDNALGVLGVLKKGNRFRAKIQVNGRKISLGYFESVESAAKAYADAKRQYHISGAEN